MSRFSHGARTSAGMVAKSQRIGARRRYASALLVIRRYGKNAIDIALTGTNKQVELLCADIAFELPKGEERAAVEVLIDRSENFRKFRYRNPAWTRAQLQPARTGGAS